MIGFNKAKDFWSEPILDKTSSMQSFPWVYPEQEGVVLSEKYKSTQETKGKVKGTRENVKNIN